MYTMSNQIKTMHIPSIKHWITGFFLLCLSPCLVFGQQQIRYSVHAGLGTSWAKINRLQTQWYYYRTLPVVAYDVGLKADYFLWPFLSTHADFSLASLGLHARRMAGVLPDELGNLKYRQEYWSDFRFYSTVLKVGLEGHLRQKFSIGLSGQGIFNAAIRESRQERWLAFPVYESKVLGTERRSGSPYFERFDFGINAFVSHRINEAWAICFDLYYSRHSVANREKGNWLEARSLKFNVHRFLN